MKKTLLFLMTLFTIGIGYSQTFIENFITYSVTSTTPNTVAIIDYNINGGTDVVIPATVTPNVSGRMSSFEDANSPMETYSITSIANNAFTSKGLTSVIIGDNVLTIGNQAFSVNFITSAIIGNNVTTIGFNAFYNNNLTTIDLPNSVTTIEARAFDDNLLTSITIPSNVTSIGFAAFRDNLITCISSEATTPPAIITESNSNDTFASDRSGINLNIPDGATADYVTDPGAEWTGFNTVTEVLGSTFVFDNITYQINATPNNEVTITNYNTAGGTNVNIPATVSSACTEYSVVIIGFNAFNGKNLSNVTIPNSVTSIENSAFQGNNLVSVTIPDSVTNIDIEAFYGNQLTSVILSNNLINIGEAAFAFNDLQGVTIPDSVITIDDGAFVQNNNMTTLVLGNSVTNIGAYVFRFTALTIITLPASVTNIGVVTFGSHLITDVYCEGLVPPIIATTGAPNTDTFDVYRSNINLHIPVGTTGAYVTDPGALWTDFNSVTEDAALSTSDFELANQVKVITTTDDIKIISSGSAQLKTYTIYSITGAKVATGKEGSIPISYMSNGIYILELTFDQGRLVKKFVK